MLRPQFGTMLVPRGPSPGLSVLASSSCDWLTGRQNRDGSWGSGAALDRLISTCHVTMTLICAGFSPQSAPLEKAAGWLAARGAAKHNNSYWILGPLAAFPGVDPEILEREVRKLEQVLRTGAKPNPDQLVEAFYLRALQATGLKGDPKVVRQSLKYILDHYSPDLGWSSRADTTTDGYAALQAFAPAEAARIRPEVEIFLTRHAQRTGTVLHWGNNISTGYTVMNIVGSDLIESPAVREMSRAAVAWLEASCMDDCYWVSDAPYGGTGDLKSVDYPTAVAVRAILAASSVGDPAYQTHVTSHRLRTSQARARFRGLVSAALLAALVATAFTPVDEAAVKWLSSYSTWDVERTLSAIGAIVGLILAVIALLIELMPEWTRFVTSRLRRMLRF